MPSIMRNNIRYTSSFGGGSGNGEIVELTQAEYDALGDVVNTNGVLYAITDGEDLTAANIAYDGSVTGLGNTVQNAIEELNTNLSISNFNISAHEERLLVLESLLEYSLFEEITQTGSINRYWTGSGTSENVTITFSRPFVKTPVVTALANSYGCTATVKSVSLSSCIINIYHDGARDGDLNWTWTAVGVVAKS